MPSWNDLVAEIDAKPHAEKEVWLRATLRRWLERLRAKRGDRNVIFYASGFLQKATAPPALTLLTLEDLNGFMANMHGMDWSKNLTLVLHTPGGVTNAAETIVEYLHSKFC